MFAVFLLNHQSFNNFENDNEIISSFHLSVQKLSEAKLTGLWARNFATIQQVLIWIFDYGPEKLPALRETGPKGPFLESPGNFPGL